MEVETVNTQTGQVRQVESWISPQLAGLILQRSPWEAIRLIQQGKVKGKTLPSRHRRLDLDSVLAFHQEWFGEPFRGVIYVGTSDAADITGLGYVTVNHHLDHGNWPYKWVGDRRMIDLAFLLEERRKPRPWFEHWHTKNDERLEAQRAEKGKQKELSA